MSEPRQCPTCGRRLDGLMAVDHSKPGLGGLLRGEGEDGGLNVVAWCFALLVIFAAALGSFAAISAGIS